MEDSNDRFTWEAGDVVSGRHVGLYARVSTPDQSVAPQLDALRAYAAARGGHAIEYVDEGASGARDRRPALDALVGAARRREWPRWSW